MNTTETETTKATNGRAKNGTACLACKRRDGTHDEGCPNNFCQECGGTAGGHHAGCKARAVFDGTTGAPIAAGELPHDGDQDDTDEEEEDEDERSADDRLADELNALDARHAKAADIEREKPPSLSGAQAAKLQAALLERTVVGLKQPLTRTIYCDAYRLNETTKVGCEGLAAFAVVDESKCDGCGKSKSKRKAALCVPHAGRYVCGESIDPQMSLFGAA
jgi:hypothetical protein